MQVYVLYSHTCEEVKFYGIVLSNPEGNLADVVMKEYPSKWYPFTGGRYEYEKVLSDITEKGFFQAYGELEQKYSIRDDSMNEELTTIFSFYSYELQI